MSGLNELRTAWRWARRDLRGGIKGFRVFLACLILGVGTVAGLRSLSQAFATSIESQSRALLGGDVLVALTHRPITDAERTFISAHGEICSVAELQAMARSVRSGERTIIELKPVSRNYPLAGAVVLSPASDLQSLLARDKTGLWGAVADPLLMDRLQLSVGDRVRVGSTEFQIRAALDKEPDAATSLYTLGPRVVVALPALTETGLVVPGSLIRYSYRVAMNDRSDAALEAFKSSAEKTFPQAGWRITDRRNAAPRLKAMVDRIAVFLTFVGLTALIVAGVGIGNAVRAFLASKTNVIATLKCLGARPQQVFVLYLLQVGALCVAGIAVGLAIGAALPFLLRGALSGLLPVDLSPRLYPRALIDASVYGLVTALLFSLAPLARARDAAPANLFRSLTAEFAGALPTHDKILLAGLAVVLIALIIALTPLHGLAAFFIAGALFTFALLRLLAWGLMQVARRLPRSAHFGLRMAIADLNRPGAPTIAIVLSLGFGLTLLGSLSLIGGNVRREIADELPRDVPALFMIGIVKEDAGSFDRLVRSYPGVGEFNRVANIRGRIVAANGKRAEKIVARPDAAWVLRGDQGLTYAATVPKGSKVVAGEWWPANYAGPPLVSIYKEAAEGLGLHVGDMLTVNILGREVSAKIANLRDIDWSYRGFNYVIVYAPGVLAAAPFSYVANVRVTPSAENGLYRAVTDAFPNVSVVRSRDAIAAILKILDQLEFAVVLTSLVALAAGALVLAGALAASHQARIYDSVMLKVLGATRGRVLGAYAVEFALLGAGAGLVAVILSSGIAFLIVKFALDAEWVFLPATLAGTLLAGMVVTLALGLAATWKALSERPAEVLRQV